MNLALLLLYAALAAITTLLVKAYSCVSIHEMKTRAREGQKAYELIHRAGSYGSMLKMLLWLLAAAFSGIFLARLAGDVSELIFVTVSTLFISGVFIFLPALRASSPVLKLASFLAPAFGWLLEHLFAVFEPFMRFAQRHLPFENHTGIYDINDLLDVIDAQRLQPDSRVDPTTLDVASNALTFNYRTVSEITTPMSKTRLLSAEDSIGPILLSELHQAGMAHFPVYDGEETNIIGVLSAIDVVEAKAGGTVRQLMQPHVNYLREDQLLAEVLEDMLVPGRHMFMVVNEFNELVGTANTEDMIRKIVGQRVQGYEIAKYEENLGQQGETSSGPQDEDIPLRNNESAEIASE